MERNTPRLGRPKPLNPLRSIPFLPLDAKLSNHHCQMDSCFDYSLCPLSSKFQFYLYPYTNSSFAKKSSISLSSGQSAEVLHGMLSRSSYFTRDHTKACLFLLIVDDCDAQKLTELSKSLPHWFGDGRNHALWLHCGIQLHRKLYNSEFIRNFGRALIVSENAVKESFRSDFDLVVSHWEKAIPKGEVWSHLPPIVPAKRKYLATYLGMKESTLYS